MASPMKLPGNTFSGNQGTKAQNINECVGLPPTTCFCAFLNKQV